MIETCYILRTYEKHGRVGLNDPWSLRQSLIYNKYNFHTDKSVWIFVQLFQCCKDALWEEFKNMHLWHPFGPHTLLQRMALSNFRWYLNDQRQFVHRYVSQMDCRPRVWLHFDVFQTGMAAHSSLLPKTVDFEVDFTDCQRLEKFLEKLCISEEILQSLEEIVHSLKKSEGFNDLPDKPKARLQPRDTHQFHGYIDQVHNYQRAALALRHRAERAFNLVSHVNLGDLRI